MDIGLSGAPQRIRVWDLPTRLTHWMLVLMFVASWATAEWRLLDWHKRSGYAMLALVLFRIYWGFAGSSTARFASFLRGPRAVREHFRELAARHRARRLGHNPAGGWSATAILATLILQVVLGLFAVDVDGLESGPLARWVSFGTGRAAARVHESVFDALLVLIALHVAAVVFYLVWLRENLVRPMISGYVVPPPDTDLHMRAAPAWRAWLGALLASLVAGAVATGFRF